MHKQTSNTRVASGGIEGGLPLLPYAYSGLHVKTANSPFLIVATPMSQALMTLPENRIIWLLPETVFKRNIFKQEDRQMQNIQYNIQQQAA